MGEYTLWRPGMRTTADRLNAATPVLTDYTPVWGATTSAPAIGNGTISGRWARADDLIWFQIAMTTGSTSTYGSGSYNWSLPITSGSGLTAPVPGRLAIGGGSAYALAGQIAAGDTACRFFVGNATGAIGPTTPGAWTSGTTVLISGWYPAA